VNSGVGVSVILAFNLNENHSGYFDYFIGEYKVSTW